MVFRILITGSREFKNYTIIHTAIRRAALDARSDRVVVISGHARGADLLAERAARELGFEVEVHRADWENHPRAGGKIRNQEMVDSGADVCLAFFQFGAKNAGTTDCAERARKAGIPVRSSHGW